MKKIREIIQENWLILVVLFIAVIFIFSGFIFNGKKFEITADQQLQYNIFYKEWIRLVRNFIKTGEFPFYSWYCFLGNNFWASKAYYVVGDIFLPLLIFSSNISRSLLYITILMVFISGISMNYLLRTLTIEKKYVRNMISIMYALSGIATLYIGNYMFHRFYAFLPLLLLSVEVFLKNKKLHYFVFMVFILFLQCYYFMYPTSIFLIFYFFFTNIIKDEKSVIKILKKSLPLIGGYIIGLLMCAVCIIPTIMYLSTNSRIGNMSMDLFWEAKVYLGYLYSLVVAPFNLYTDIPYMFFSGTNGHAYWYSVYTSVLTVVFLSQLVFGKYKHKKAFIISYLLLLLFLFIKPLNSIIHGFSEPSFRWVFLIVLFQLIMIAFMWDKTLEENEDYVKDYMKFVTFFLTISIICFSLKIINVNDYKVHLLVSVGFLILGLIYSMLLRFKKNAFLCALIIIELIASSTFLIRKYSSNYYDYNDTLTQEYVNYFQDIDTDSMYRIYINPDNLFPISDLNLNQSMYYDYLSTVTYDSTYEGILSEFLNWNNINWHIIKLDEINVLKLLGVKYYGIVDGETLPTGQEYVYKYDLNHFHMYMLADYNHIGHTFSQFISKTDLNGVDMSAFDWNNILIVDEKMLAELADVVPTSKAQFIVEDHSNNYLYGRVDLASKSVLFISVPYSSGWKVLDENNKELSIINVDGGFIGIILDQGTHYLSLRFTPPGFKLGGILTIIGTIGFSVILINDYSYKKKQKRLKNVDDIHD